MCAQEIGVLCVCVCIRNEAQSLPCPSARKSVPPVLSKHIPFSSVSIARVEDRMHERNISKYVLSLLDPIFTGFPCSAFLFFVLLKHRC